MALYSQSNYYYYSYITQASTDANGVYHLTLVAPGIYQIRFYDPNRQYASQWYEHGRTHAEATNVIVAGQPVTGVNGSLVLGRRPERRRDCSTNGAG